MKTLLKIELMRTKTGLLIYAKSKYFDNFFKGSDIFEDLKNHLYYSLDGKKMSSKYYYMFNQLRNSLFVKDGSIPSLFFLSRADIKKGVTVNFEGVYSNHAINKFKKLTNEYINRFYMDIEDAKHERIQENFLSFIRYFEEDEKLHEAREKFYKEFCLSGDDVYD